MGVKLLFQYKSTPSFGFFGTPGGSSLSVYSNGKVVKRNYVFGENRATDVQQIACVPEMAERIECLLISYKDELAKIPEKLNNGTLDGSHDCFRFGEKSITSWTIHKCNLEEVKERNPSYYNCYKDNMIFENLVIEIYNEIAMVINSYARGADMRII